MAWRSVVISQPAKLKREHFSLVIEQTQSARVPFEDIAVIVLNNREITLTHPVLSACADYGIALYSTGDNHQPNGVFLPFLSHGRATRMMRLQLDIDKPQTKRAWAEVVKVKISNQALCLKLAKKGDFERLESYASRVRSGDTENMEAQASSYYFPQLFGKGFHRSEQNAFNLADDLIEPYRALVDLHTLKETNPHADPLAELTPSGKAGLVALLNADVKMPRGNMSVLASIEQATEALVRLYEGGDESVLELPVLIGLQQHEFEM